MKCNCNSSVQSNIQSFNSTAAKMAIESMESWKILKIHLRWGGVTLAKINQSHWNANWNSNSWLQSNKPSFNPIAAKMAKKSLENWKNLKFC
jgi:hypothetical protein